MPTRASFRSPAGLRARRVPAPGPRRPRRGRQRGGGRPHRVGQDGGRPVRGGAGPGARAARPSTPRPLKALSNQKYSELVRRHGPEAVGLLTGDNSINGDRAGGGDDHRGPAQHDLRLVAERSTGLRYVILDEVHYLQNAYRGPVWEEVIIHAPPGVDLVCLSATVSNAEELADWIRTVRGETGAVIEERRPVALHDLYLLGDKGSERLLLLPTLVDGRPNPEAVALDSKTLRHPGMRGRPRGRLFTPRRVEVLELLDEHDMLPAIYFIFSRAACDDAVAQCVREGQAPHHRGGAAPDPGHRRGARRRPLRRGPGRARLRRAG